jgi:hypothetical protein
MTVLDPRRLQEALVRDLAAAGERYTIVRATRKRAHVTGYPGLAGSYEKDDELLELRVDDQPDMWFDSSHVEDLDDLRAVLDQVQDVVMETTTEPWPRCPWHYHPLEPWPKDAWIVWRCPTTRATFGIFGQI